MSEIEVHIGPAGEILLAPFCPKLKDLALGIKSDEDVLTSEFCG